MKKSGFLKHGLLAFMVFAVLGLNACKETKKEAEKEMEEVAKAEEKEPFFKLSLAQWSIHRMIREEGMDPYSFAEKAKAWGFEGLEYVSQLYEEELEKSNYSEEAMAMFVEKCNAEAKKHGLKNVLIMIDHAGDLSVNDKKERDAAIEKHAIWVDAAAAMGCTSVRVNLFGGAAEKNPEEWHKNSVDAMGRLAAYASKKNINVIVENHGGLSSDAEKVVAVIKEINMPNCGTLPDFGNFCVKRDSGERWGGNCIEEYNIYKGVAEMMPYAKGVSAKSHDFDKEGNETAIDYTKMLQIVKDAGYTGYIGVEYEGDVMGEEAGIMATKELLLNAAKHVE
ncbi:sugar phosphate isomerase/epimerase family protein [Maribacter sp. 2210JD10-5]|uniref:sugar phosphate isomerase/epimerase family protein n=1 Tax=Maribacter sp. 2210JD10-5 TaxID=3386272 RepID=UPI0039BCDAF4